MTLKAVGSDPSAWEGTHIRFVPSCLSKSGKTMLWDVATKEGYILGEVKWYARWRKYTFHPSDDCVFEETCLGELAEFIKERTREQKAGI